MSPRQIESPAAPPWNLTGLPRPDRNDRRRLLWLALLWTAAGVACLAVDIPLAKFFKANKTPHELRIMFYRAETFGHAYGVLAIAITVAVVDRFRRPASVRLVCGALGAGIAADILKMIVVRTRPRIHHLEDGLWASFHGVAGWNDGGGWPMLLNKAHQSLPSAHTATAVGLAVGLGLLYPQARRWFAILAFLCAMNRVDGCAHFASDACWGSAVGLAMATLVFSPLPANIWMDRLAVRLKLAAADPAPANKAVKPQPAEAA